MAHAAVPPMAHKQHEPMTLHTLSTIVGSWWMLLHMQQQTVAERHGLYFESTTSHHKSDLVNLCQSDLKQGSLGIF